MKIKKIEVRNFKAISNQIAEFNGCSAIVTAGNNKGKTSLLSGLINRFRGEKPNLILKEGEEKGYNIIELSDGSKIEWKFTEKSESFSYVTKEGLKVTNGVLSMLNERYFGKKFDIDKFLNSTGKEQTKELQRIVGIDFEEIDKRYKTAYDARTDANKELKRVAGLAKKEPEKVEKPEIESLKIELTEKISANKQILEKWEKENEKHIKEILEFNKAQALQKIRHNEIVDCIEFLKKQGFENNELNKFAETNKPEEEKNIISLENPILNSTKILEEKIAEGQEMLRKYDAYERNLEEYNKWIKEGKEARENQQKWDKEVKSIEQEKREMIAKAEIPSEFEITEEGIMYKGFPLTDSQTSSSSKYIAALKLGAMVLGEVKTMHFDASFLDKNSLAEIQKWANDNNLQLLIERPDFEGGEIAYQIIQHD